MDGNKTRLYQYELDLRNQDCGMFYVFRMKDGSFFLIDSGHAFTISDCERMHDFLRSLTPQGEKIHIAGWFFSHAHDDHIGLFMDFANAGYDDFVLDAVYCNFPSLDHASADLWNKNTIEYLMFFELFCDLRKDIKRVTIHTGDVLEIGDLRIEVMLTHEDVCAENIYNFNDTSSVIMVTCENTKIFFPGDAGTEESLILTEKYGKSLKADIVQYSHHGYKGLLSDCYRLIDAPVVLIPTQYDNFLRSKAFSINEEVLGRAKEVYFSQNGTVSLELPYVPGTANVSERELYPDLDSMKYGVEYIKLGMFDKVPKRDEKFFDTFKKCFMNTMETTVSYDGRDVFMITGDIPAMWLRDSSMQILPYLHFVRKDPSIKLLIYKLIQRQFGFVSCDPYANAFLENENMVSKHSGDRTQAGKGVWERKFETDSLSFPMWLLAKFFEETREPSVLTETVMNGLEAAVGVFETETDHSKSPYYFERPGKTGSDTLTRGGLGPECAVTGLIWSGFRPSDDACIYGYNIPGNMFAAYALHRIHKMSLEIGEMREPDGLNVIGPIPDREIVVRFAALGKRALKLAERVDAAIKKTPVMKEGFGEIYPYEVDGLGNYICMDDANQPGLLGLPWLGAVSADDPVWINTRRFVLSGENPYFYEGKEAKGLGSAHTDEGFIWPIGLIVQALTSDSDSERATILDVLLETTAGTGYMHESFNADDSAIFTRPWFAWANSMFAELIIEMIGEKINT